MHHPVHIIRQLRNMHRVLSMHAYARRMLLPESVRRPSGQGAVALNTSTEVVRQTIPAWRNACNPLF